MTIPSNLYGVSCIGTGGPEVMQWASRKLDNCAEDEVIIEVKAAGLNRADILQRQGRYPPPEGVTDILGLEVSGIICAIGNLVNRWKVGDEVSALLSGGGYATHVCVPAAQCLPKPSHMSFLEAATLPEAIITVWSSLFKLGALRSDDCVLLHGGGGGVGTFAIQMVRQFGATIIVTIGDELKREACLKLGANFVINYRQEDFVKRVLEITDKKGVSIVLDTVGGDYVNRHLSILKFEGRHISLATPRGREAVIDLGLIMRKRLLLTGSTLRSLDRSEKARLAAEVEKNIWPLLTKKMINPLIYKVYSIKEVGEAHKVMESSVHIGKIVLELP